MKQLRSRRVLIVEGNADGHRLFYVSLLASAAAAAGEEVLLATRASVISSPEYAVHMAKFGSQLKLTTTEDFSVRDVERLCRVHAIDHAVIPDGDSFAYQLSKGHPWTWRGTVTALVMREKGQPSRVPGSALVKTAVKGVLLQAAHCRRGVEVRVLKSASWRGFSLLPTTRDPVVLNAKNKCTEPHALPSLSKSRFWFGLVGIIGQRKNLPLVAASLASLGRPDIGLLVAGRVEAGVLEEAEEHLERIRGYGGQVTIVDRLLSDEELDLAVRQLDCVVLAHSNEGPSGILGKALAAETRIVAAGAKSLRLDCRHIGQGALWAPLDEQRLSVALAKATNVPIPDANSFASAQEFASGLLRQ